MVLAWKAALATSLFHDDVAFGIRTVLNPPSSCDENFLTTIRKRRGALAGKWNSAYYAKTLGDIASHRSWTLSRYWRTPGFMIKISNHRNLCVESAPLWDQVSTFSLLQTNHANRKL